MIQYVFLGTKLAEKNLDADRAQVLTFSSEHNMLWSEVAIVIPDPTRKGVLSLRTTAACLSLSRHNYKGAVLNP
jgi:hypothetical protein